VSIANCPNGAITRNEMTDHARTTCYAHLAAPAAEVLGLVDYRNPDDIFKFIIGGQQANNIEIARKVLLEALDHMRDDHG